MPKYTELYGKNNKVKLKLLCIVMEIFFDVND